MTAKDIPTYTQTLGVQARAACAAMAAASAAQKNTALRALAALLRDNVASLQIANAKDIERMLGICEKYLPEQAWWYAADELTDRSEKFLASETVREKLFRLTGDELPYTSTVVIDKFEEEPGRGKQKRLLRIAATIVVERDGHKAMVIGDKGERIKRIGMETRVELEKLLDCKVFIEMWVKVRSGWADDEARVRSFGYE